MNPLRIIGGSLAARLSFDVFGSGPVEPYGRIVDGDARVTLSHLDRRESVHLASVGIVEAYRAFALIAKHVLGAHLFGSQFVFCLSLGNRFSGLCFIQVALVVSRAGLLDFGQVFLIGLERRAGLFHEGQRHTDAVGAHVVLLRDAG